MTAAGSGHTPSAKEVFADALEMEPAERSAFIERACEGHTAVVAEVHQLLSMHESARKFLSLPTKSPDLGEAPGTIIGKYKLRELIGEGGFGSVFLAEQEHPVRRRVALKIIKLGMDTRSVVARFEQERQALALMDHPNIAKVFDAGSTAGGRPYFVMELVKGDAITTYCDRNQLTIPERLRLFTQVCHAVHHAHTKGVVHRDIKPSNILVATQDGRPHARIIDFGIAKATSHRLTEKTVFTEFRNFIGTPEYMSPEQAEGSLDIDTRTDVYSLGVLLYELLTGTTPFDPARLRSAAFAELQRIIREVEPPRPSTRLPQSAQTLPSVAAQRRVDPTRLGGQVRGDLDWIVMKSLDKDRARRYDSASALADDLRRHLVGEAVVAAPPTQMYRVRKFVSRHRGAVLACSLIGLALTSGAVGVGFLAVKERRARERTEKAESEMRRRSEDLEQVARFQSEQLRAIRPDTIAEVFRAELLAQTRSAMEKAQAQPERIEADLAALRSLLARPNLTSIAVKVLDTAIIDRSVKSVRDQFADQPLVRARLLQSLADLMLELHLPERATGPQAEALTIRREKLGPDHPDTIASMLSAAGLARAQGRLDQAAPLIEEAFEASRRLPTPHEHTALAALVNLSSLRMIQGKADEAEPLQREALELSRRVLGESHPDTAGAMANLAFTLGSRSRFDEAVTLMRDALAIRRRALGDDHPDTAESVNNLGFMLVDAGRGAEAESLFREALDARRRLLGDDHPLTITAQSNIGSALRAQGKAAAAAEAFRSAWEARVRTLGPDHPDALTTAANLGVALLDANRTDEAVAFHQRAYEGRLRMLGPDDPRTLSSMSNMGSLLDRLGKSDEAEPLARGAFESRRRLLGPDHADTLHSQHNYASILAHRGQLEAAASACEEVLAKRRVAPGSRHPRTLTSVHLLGTIRRDQGRLAEAETLFKEAMEGRGKHPLANDSRYLYALTLLEQSKFEEAEREASRLEAGLRPEGNDDKLANAVELLVKLYEDWNRVSPGAELEAKAASWRARRSGGAER
jgi:serine/threonine protein kinase/tetratricopeptide (TPR) repeat protein